MQRVKQSLIFECCFKKRLALRFRKGVGGITAEQFTNLVVGHLLASQLPPINSIRCFRQRKSQV